MKVVLNEQPFSIIPPQPNHIHRLFQDNNEDRGGLLRDVKGFTSKKMIAIIKGTGGTPAPTGIG
ncbi:MAG: hypothetical protein WA749_08460 [Gelidibacter sp.]